MGKSAIIVMVSVSLAGCSSSPTAPTPAPPPVSTPPPVVSAPPPTTPPVVTPPSTPPPVIFPPTDPRFDLAFYRRFVHADGTEPLRRHSAAPRIYLRTVDDAGRAIDQRSLDRSAEALENTAGLLTGVFGLAGMERGTSTREGQAGWITVRWSDRADPLACGRAAVGGDLITLYPRTPRCRCDGLEVSISTIKHELGHALGFWHTGTREDLMSGIPDGICDRQPSAREQYHAAIAYTRPNGSAAP